MTSRNQTLAVNFMVEAPQWKIIMSLRQYTCSRS